MHTYTHLPARATPKGKVPAQEVPQLDEEALEKQRPALDAMLARMSMGTLQCSEEDAVAAAQVSETQKEALDGLQRSYQERVRKAREKADKGNVGGAAGGGGVAGVSGLGLCLGIGGGVYEGGGGGGGEQDAEVPGYSMYAGGGRGAAGSEDGEGNSAGDHRDLDASILRRIEERKRQLEDMPCQDVWATEEETQSLAELVP
jgi:hypothetical protein